MARLALGLLGAGLGAFTGIGANTGYMIGSAIGGFLFPDPPVVTEGPRLGDLSLSASTYGTTIPIGYGTLRMGGNLIWSSGLREVRTEESVGGKGGAPTQVQVTYTYFADLAYAFAEGPASEMLRLWFDNKLVLDIRPPDAGLSAGVDIGPTEVSALNKKFYPGTETQLPDSTIESIEGVGNVPAHRGLVYVVFNNLNVTEYGNRVPQCTAEIAFKSTAASSGRLATQVTSTATSHALSDMAFDPVRRLIYMRGTSDNALRVVNMDNLTETRQNPDDDVFDTPSTVFSANGEWSVDSDGFLYVNAGVTNGRPIIKINPSSLNEVGRFGAPSGSLINGPGGFAALSRSMVVEVINPIPDPSTGTSGRRKFFVGGTTFSDIGIIDAETMTYIFDDPDANFITITGMVPVPAEDAIVGENVGWFASQTSGNGNVRIYKIRLEAIAGTLTGDIAFGVTLTLADTVTNAAWSADGNGTLVIGPMLDRTDGGLIFIKPASSFSGVYIFKWVEGIGVVWTSTSVTAAPVQNHTISTGSVIEDGRFGWTTAGEKAILIDTTDGSVIIENLDILNFTSPVASNNGDQFYDSETQSIVSIQGTADNFIGQFFLGRESGGAEALSTIVADLSDRVGLEVGDLDVTELTDNVRGYSVTRQMPARAAVEPLATAFLFDGVESDDVIEFKKRGRDSERTLTDDDLLVVNRDTHDVITESRTQEVEIPERISIAYMDIDTDYQQGTQSVKRIKNPSPTMRSTNEQTVQVPIVFNATEAEQLAEKLLFTAWNERTAHKVLLPWEHLDLDPADVIQLAITRDAITTNLRTRITKAVVNLDMSISVESLSEEKITVESDAVSDGGLGFPQQRVPGPAVTQLWLFDIPLLRDIDDGGVVAARMYYAMDGFRANWPGGVLYNSKDGFLYNNTGLKSSDPVAHGVVTTLIPDTSLPWQTDTITTISVVLEEGSLSSVTDTQFLNDVNTCLIGNTATGEFEIINFRDAVLEADGTYTISHLIRGRRGTEVWTGNHAKGDLFFFLDNPEIAGFLEELADLNLTEFYRAVGFSQPVEAASIHSILAIGRSQMPYAPVLLDAVVDGSDNIDLSWVRRNRIAGELRDLVGDVPLSEDSELYEVDILDAPGGTVVRSFTGLTTPLIEYTKANIIADLAVGTGATTLSVGATNQFTRPAGSFVTDGFLVGMKIETSSFTAGANNGIFTVTNVAAGTLTVNENTLVVETGTGDELMDAIREDDLTYVVYQISGQVGRGFGGEDTIIL